MTHARSIDSVFDNEKHSLSPELNAVSENLPTSTAPEFPEGGFAAWATVAGACIVHFCSFGSTLSYGVYQDFYTRVYITNQTSSSISWIGSVNAFIVLSGSLIAGRSYDRGYFYYLLYGGSFLIAFSLFMLSLAKPNNFYQIFLTQGLGAGLGVSMVYVPTLTVVSHYFQKRGALAMTIVAAGSSLGSVIHPIMLNPTINGSLGFANATRANAAMITGLLLIACVLIRTRLPPPEVLIPLKTSLKKFSKDGAYIAATFGFIFAAMGFYFPLFFIQLSAIDHGLNPTFAFYSLVILNFSSIFGRIVPGFLANSLGVGNMIAVSTACCCILIFGMVGLSSVASVAMIAILYGFFVGAYVTLTGPLVAVVTDDMSELGARMGVAFALSGIGGLTGPPIQGALLGSDLVWWRPAVFSGLVSIIGLASFAIMLVILRRRKQAAEMGPS